MDFLSTPFGLQRFKIFFFGSSTKKYSKILCEEIGFEEGASTEGCVNLYAGDIKINLEDPATRENSHERWITCSRICIIRINLIVTT